MTRTPTCIVARPVIMYSYIALTFTNCGLGLAFYYWIHKELQETYNLNNSLCSNVEIFTCLTSR